MKARKLPSPVIYTGWIGRLEPVFERHGLVGWLVYCYLGIILYRIRKIETSCVFITLCGV